MADGREARAGIAVWIRFYNGRRPHQALAGRTPMAVWREGVTGPLADKHRGHDTAFGRRSRVAHMPTATTTATNDLHSVIKEVGAGGVSIKTDCPVVPPTGSTSILGGQPPPKGSVNRLRSIPTYSPATAGLNVAGWSPVHLAADLS